MVYYAGPMFSEAELAFNVKAAAELEKAGLTVSCRSATAAG